MKQESGSAGGAFGRWETDEFGLPAYEYTCDQDRDPRAAAFTTRGPIRLHWHQIGNDAITAIAANRGEVQALESSRGLQWLCYHDAKRLCPGGGIGVVVPETGSAWTDLYAPEKMRHGYRRVFGTFYFQKEYETGGLRLEHTIAAPFGDTPALLCELTISNTSSAPITAAAYEFFGVRLHYMIADMLVMPPDREYFGTSPLENVPATILSALRTLTATDTDSLRTRHAAQFRWEFEHCPDDNCVIQTPVFTGGRRPPRNRPASKSYYPESVFLARLDGPADVVFQDTRALVAAHPGVFAAAGIAQAPPGGAPAPCLCLGERFTLQPGESRRLVFVYGYANKKHIGGIVSRMRDRTRDGAGVIESEAEPWRRAYCYFETQHPGAEWLQRETVWHAAYTRGAALRDNYYESRYIPQGGAYEFLHGLRGAVRDLAFFTIPLVYMDPKLAREIIEFCLRLQRPDGSIMYTNFGYGKAGGALVHENPTDLQLSLLWSLSEYLFYTRDFKFLDSAIPYYPKDAGASTVRERIALSLRYLFDKIGTGPHGLLRVGDGDWSDGISLFVKDRRAFVKQGESAYNTAMALYVLPRIAALLKRDNPPLADETERRGKTLLDATLASWTGRWFPRGYDGRGKPFGHDRLFLEHHAWLLVAQCLPPDMRDTLLKHIREMLDDPSPFGQLVLFPAAPTAFQFHEKGWDVNGGVWYAINFLLAWGYASADPERAWAALRKNACVRRAEVYPDIWYGLWSGPDAYNAHYAPRGGETYYHLPTPMTDFPVMNMNLHANFLLALIKLCGLEPGMDGLTLRPSVPLDQYTLRLPTLTLDVSPQKVLIEFKKGIPAPQSIEFEPVSPHLSANTKVVVEAGKQL